MPGDRRRRASAPPRDAAIAMELGCTAVLMNTGIARREGPGADGARDEARRRGGPRGLRGRAACRAGSHAPGLEPARRDSRSVLIPPRPLVLDGRRWRAARGRDQRRRDRTPGARRRRLRSGCASADWSVGEWRGLRRAAARRCARARRCACWRAGALDLARAARARRRAPRRRRGAGRRARARSSARRPDRRTRPTTPTRLRRARRPARATSRCPRSSRPPRSRTRAPRRGLARGLRVRGAGVPVLALGGIDAAIACAVLRAGALGVVAITALGAARRSRGCGARVPPRARR